MKKVIVITGASSGFGELTAHELAKAGHVVYASMRETTGRNLAQVEAAKKFAAENKGRSPYHRTGCCFARVCGFSDSTHCESERATRCRDSQRWTHGLWPCRGIHARATRGAL
jgi:NAD(P)-dependent dehydrogenase (short-subunit alcohol dehydrogenase family)